MENPDTDITVDCFIYKSTYDNPHPKHKTYEIDDISVIDTKLVIEYS